MLKEIGKALFYKNNEFSKTALFLSTATIAVLFLYIFQSLFAGAILLGWWTIPAFSPAAATSVLGSLAALYAVNHGWVNKSEGLTPEQMKEFRDHFDEAVEAVKGENDGS